VAFWKNQGIKWELGVISIDGEADLFISTHVIKKGLEIFLY
jgi:hypothetical protein